METSYDTFIILIAMRAADPVGDNLNSVLAEEHIKLRSVLLDVAHGVKQEIQIADRLTFNQQA